MAAIKKKTSAKRRSRKMLQVHQVGKPYPKQDRSGFSNRPFRAQIKIASWGEALIQCMDRKSISRHNLATQLSITEKLVKAWEHGEAYPTSVELTRMYTRMPWLRQYTHLLPPIVRHDPYKDPATGKPITLEEQVRMIDDAVEPAAPPAPAPTVAATTAAVPSAPALSFHDALRAAREGANLKRTELALLVTPTVTSGAVSFWERGRGPMRQYYEQLCDLLPDLKNAAPPRFPRSYKRAASGAAFPIPKPTPTPAAPDEVVDSPPPSPEPAAPPPAPEPAPAPAPVAPASPPPPVLTVVPSRAPHISPDIQSAREAARQDFESDLIKAGAAYGVALARAKLAGAELRQAEIRMEELLQRATSWV